MRLAGWGRCADWSAVLPRSRPARGHAHKGQLDERARERSNTTIYAIANTIAGEALAFPPDERGAFIQRATRDLRDHFLSKFSEGPKREKAEVFVAGLEDLGMEALKLLEALGGGTTGRA